MVSYIYKLLLSYGFHEGWAIALANGAVVIFIFLLCTFAYLFVKNVLVRAIKAYVKASKNKWDDILIQKGLLERIAKLAPAIIIHALAGAFPAYQDLIERLAYAYIIFISILALDLLLDAIEGIYRTLEVSKEKPIKGFLQVIKIILYIVAGVLIICVLINRSPWLLLSGIGALSAVLLLIFQNSILGFVAGVQLTSNDMVRLGDWIEMPKYDADGEVIDITLHTVKVQNWDKTITTIPSYALISDSFKNWRGMQESGGRRIKRSIYIDMISIRFCTDDMLERFEKIHYLVDYINDKEKEIEEYNKENKMDSTQLVNGRRMTNIGTFRAYVQVYLNNHPKLNKGMPIMVRQLAPGQYGIPIEIYAFTNDIAWANYESIQGDIFDHILAIIPQFDLKIFQSPSGQDLKEGLHK